MSEWQDEGTSTLFRCLNRALEDIEPLSVIEKACVNDDHDATSTLSVFEEVDHWQQSLFHIACRHEAPVEVIRFLIQKSPPQAVNRLDHFGYTPLANACQRDSKALHWNNADFVSVVQDLLRQDPRTAEMTNGLHGTPLHMACMADDVSVDAIKLLAKAAPATLGMVDDAGNAPLHYLCANAASPESTLAIDFVASAYPMASLIENEDGLFPLQISNTARPPVKELTDAAALGLVEASLAPNSCLPEPVIAHVQLCAPDFAGSFNCCDGGAVPLRPFELETLLSHDDLQSMLHEKSYQSLVNGLVRMNRAGRSYVGIEPDNKGKGALVLTCVRENASCLFIHLRENPSLLQRYSPLLTQEENEKKPCSARSDEKCKKYSAEQGPS